LQDEASKHEIFTTKTSASSIASNNKQNGTPGVQNFPELKRTINAIGTIQSVLSCQIFKQIVNVSDSLDELSYHLSLRPSIGPADIDFNDEGELILAPPIEVSNYIGGQLDGQYLINQDHLDAQNELENNNMFFNNGSYNMDYQYNRSIPDNEINLEPGDQNHMNLQRTQGAAIPRDVNYLQSGPVQVSLGQSDLQSNQIDRINGSLCRTNNLQENLLPNHKNYQQESAYDSEKLVSNGISNQKGHRAEEKASSGSEVERTRVKSVAAAFESAINGSSSEGRRLYKANGSLALNRMVPSPKQGLDSQPPPKEELHYLEQHQAQTHINEGYEDSDEIMSFHADKEQPVANQAQHSSDSSYTYANAGIRKQQGEQVRQNQPAVVQPARASPSASAGSTVRLADECDSGTSSFRSHAVRSALCSPQSSKPIEQLDEDPMDNEIEQELIEKMSSEMEKIKVTLEKGPEGIGITIAGYTCEQEEISGIFIKGITPGSPADRCGKIKILDQIFAVNGQEILGLTNPEATNVLRRHTGKVVTLELMRYLADSRFQKLQNLLENAAPASSFKNPIETSSKFMNQNQSTTSAVSRSPSKINSPTEESENDLGFNHRKLAQTDEVSNQYVNQSPSESIYKNSSVFRANEYSNGAVVATNNGSTTIANLQSGIHSPMPVAAQRCAGSSIKVIETKQGARNTVDIRSPMFRPTATATYVNNTLDSDSYDTQARCAIGIAERLRREAPEELMRGSEPEWERDVEIIELQRDSSSQGLGFTVKEYDDPKDQRRSIIMVTSITPGGIAEMNGKLSLGDLLVFVDDKSLEGASLNEAVKALKETNGQVRLGVLKLRR